ncbi:thioredoxin family protein [Luteolibacter ambystomatis]|uniref:Thioredoxin family protein n=1 Tax=Luteolibacter ambystomatis TaxID=2824561 RepID=A0A975G613_9BACT|nr:thioredoxin family protein [Luteolibacter ambystomatis]QUE49977.1 thioredoxin family protein [Luteolibacter ambystomatis]
MKTTFKHLAFAAASALICSGSAFASGEGWVTDFEAAKKQAAAEKKDLLIDFTGSDWCGWCIKLDEEVFSKDPFKEGVKDKFVLVSLDFPQKPENKAKLGEAAQAQNKELQKKYSVSGFPTIMLCDSEGKPFGQTGYQQGGPEKYVTHLDELRAGKKTRDDAFAAAGKAEGVEKAKQLVAALKAMKLDDDLVSSFYGDIATQIKAADPKDETGFAKAAAAKEKQEAFQKEAMGLMRSKDTDGLVALVDRTLKDEGLDGEAKQQVIMAKASAYAQTGKFDEAMKICDEAVALAPKSEAAPMIESFKGRLAKMKEKAAEAPKETKEKE